MTLTLLDGTEIDYATGEVARERSEYVEVPSNGEAQRLIVSTRRHLNDLPLPPQQMNTISVVLSYELFGLSNSEIAIATELTVAQVEVIQSAEAYEDMRNKLSATLQQSIEEDVRGLFAKKAKTAANVMVGMLDSKSESNKITAAKDIMDRGGFRPNDVVEHKHQIEGGLMIEYIKRGPDDNVPVIDVTPKEIN